MRTVKFGKIEIPVLPTWAVEEEYRKYKEEVEEPAAIEEAEIGEKLYEIKKDRRMIFPREKVNLSGWFTVDRLGKYRIDLAIHDLEARQDYRRYIIGDLEVVPPQQVELERDEIEKKCLELFENRIYKEGSFFHFADPRYWTIEPPNVREVLKNVKPPPRIDHEWDCDDFSHFTMGIFHQSHELGKTAFFILWFAIQSPEGWGGHALNGFCGRNRFYMVDIEHRVIFKGTRKNWYFWVLLG